MWTVMIKKKLGTIYHETIYWIFFHKQYDNVKLLILSASSLSPEKKKGK